MGAEPVRGLRRRGILNELKYPAPAELREMYKERPISGVP